MDTLAALFRFPRLAAHLANLAASQFLKPVLGKSGESARSERSDSRVILVET